MIDNLVRASVEGAVMVGGIWVLSRALPLLSPALRATLWWCAAAKFIVTVFWAVPLVLPILPAAAPVAVQQVTSSVASSLTDYRLQVRPHLQAPGSRQARIGRTGPPPHSHCGLSVSPSPRW